MSIANAAGMRLAKGKILFVEDDPSILEMQQVIMKRLGYEVIATNDGEKAFDLIRRERPDVVVLDVLLPGCDGITLARRMRADSELRHIPIAFVTGKREGFDFNQGFAAGGQVYLPKPFTARALQVAVESLLRQQQAEVRPTT